VTHSVAAMSIRRQLQKRTFNAQTAETAENSCGFSVRSASSAVHLCSEALSSRGAPFFDFLRRPPRPRRKIPVSWLGALGVPVVQASPNSAPPPAKLNAAREGDTLRPPVRYEVDEVVAIGKPQAARRPTALETRRVLSSAVRALSGGT
jgi:hypothetical protein